MFFSGISTVLFKFLTASETSTRRFHCVEKENPLLYKIQHIVIPKLLAATTPKERKQISQELARELIEKGASFPKVEWQQFAMMQTPYLIESSVFEGASISLSIQAWKKWIGLFAKGEGKILSLPLTNETIKVLELQLGHLEKLVSIIPGLKKESLSNDELKTIVDQVFDYFSLVFSKGGEEETIYFPSGYRKTEFNQGHSLPLKIQRKKGKITITPLNQGAGLRHHPVLSITTTNERSSFRYFPIEVDEKIFFSKTGRAAFGMLIRMRVDPLISGSRHREVKYNTEMILDILKTLGTMKPFPKLVGDRRCEVKGQVYPVCSDKGVKCVIRDILIDQDFPHEGLIRFFLNAKIVSLLGAIHTDPPDDSEQVSYYLLRMTIKRISTFLLKHHTSILYHEEIALCYALFDHLYKDISEKEGALKPPPRLLPSFEHLPIKESGLIEHKLFLYVLKTNDMRRVKKKTSLSRPKFKETRPCPPCTLENITTIFQVWTKNLCNQPTLERVDQLKLLLASLPIPREGKPTFWDEVELKDIPKVVETLLELIDQGLKCTWLTTGSSKPPFTSLVITLSTVTCLADYLTRRLYPSQFKDFALPFPFNTLPILNKQSFILANPLENARFFEITNYFQAQAKDKRVIFPFRSQVNIKTLVKNFLYKEEKEKNFELYNHLAFLQQFKPEGKDANADTFVELWVDQDQTYLPPEVHHLKELLGYCFALFQNEKLIAPIRIKHIVNKEAFEIYLFTQANSKYTFNVHHCCYPFNTWIYHENRWLNPKETTYLDEKESSLSFKAHLIQEETDHPYLSNTLSSYSKTDLILLPLFVTFIKNNLHLLDKGEFFSTFESVLFAPGKLARALTLFPDFVDTLREAIDQGIDFFGFDPRKIDYTFTFLFFGITIESFIQMYTQDPSTEIRLAQFEKIIKEDFMPKKGVLVNALLIYLLKTKATPDLEEIFLLAFRYIRSYSSSSHTDNKFRFLQDIGLYLKRSVPQFKELLQDKKTKNRLLSSLTQYESMWTGEFPYFSAGLYTVDCNHFTIVYKGRGEIVKGNQFDAVIYAKRFVCSLDIDGTFFFKDGVLLSEDGTLHINVSKPMPQILRKLILDGKMRWYQLLVKDEFILKTITESIGLPLTDKLVYVPMEGKGDIMIRSWFSDIPELLLEEKDKGTLVIKLDRDGNRTPCQYIAGIKSICLYNFHLDSIEEVTFFPYNLKFIANRESNSYRLDCVEYSGFFLSSNQSIDLLAGYDEILVLENQYGQIKIVLNGSRIRYSKDPFSTKLVGYGELLSKRLRFTYDFDPLKQTLTFDSPEAGLYLSYLFSFYRDRRKQSGYILALGALQEALVFSKSLSEDEASLCLAPLNTNDTSISGLALKLQILLYVIKKNRRLTKDRWSQNKLSKIKEIVDLGLEVYNGYLHSLGNEEIVPIPLELRPTFEEESLLLTIFKRACDDFEDFPLVERRYALFINQFRTVSLNPLIYYTRPTIYQQLATDFKKDIDSSHYSHAASSGSFRKLPDSLFAHDITLAKQFWTLFDKAMEAKTYPAPFDFDLLILSHKTREKDTLHSIMALIFFIRHNQEAFADLTDLDRQDVDSVNLLIRRSVEIRENLDDKWDKFLTSTLTFPINRTFERNIPTPAEVPSLPFISSTKRSFLQNTLCSIAQTHLQKEEVPVTRRKKPPFLDPDLQGNDPIEEKITASVKRGHQQNLKSTRMVYTFASDTSSKELKNKLLRINKSNKKKCLHLLEEISYSANMGPADKGGKISENELFLDHLHHIANRGEQRLFMSIRNPLFEAFIKKAPGEIAIQNPHLSTHDIETLISLVTQYLITTRELAQGQKALKHLRKLEKHPNHPTLLFKLGQLLENQVTYSTNKYPEILAYEALTGLLLRDEQLEILRQVIKSVKTGMSPSFLLYQFAAGGGKTSVLIPLLVIAIAREGKIPIVYSPNSLYDIDKENLGTTLFPLKHLITLIEIEMDSKIDIESLKEVYKALKEALEKKKGVIITPTTYYALVLQYHFTRVSLKDEEKAKYLSAILNLIKKKGFAIIDESLINLDPLTQAIFGTGDTITLPLHQQKLYAHMFDLLIGNSSSPLIVNKESVIDKFLRLKLNEQALLSTEEIKAAQKALATYFTFYTPFNIPTKERTAYYSYFKQKGALRPKSLGKIAKKNKEAASQIELTRKFITEIFPHALSMKGEISHGLSREEGQHREKPRHRGKETSSDFEDPDLVVVTSMIGTHQRGLLKEQIRVLCESMIQEHLIERRIHSNKRSTSVSIAFRNWMKRAGLKYHLRHVVPKNDTQLEELYLALKDDKEAKSWFFKAIILKEIESPKERYSATPADLKNGHLGGVLFSAMPGPIDIYPQGIDFTKYDEAFEAKVLSQLCRKENSFFTLIDTTNPISFFRNLYTIDREFFLKMRVITDVMGLFASSTNIEVARAFFNILSEIEDKCEKHPFDGVITMSDKEERVLLWWKEEKEPREIQGNDIKKACRHKGRKWSETTFLTLIDPSHIVGLNLRQEDDAPCFFIIGAGCTKSDLVQALLRMRGFFEGQTIRWGIPVNLAARIPTNKGQGLTSQAMIHWTIKNEAIFLKPLLIARAFQEIDYLIKTYGVSKKRDEILRSTTTRSTYQIGVAPHSLDKTENVLFVYARRQYEKLGLFGSWHLERSLKGQVQKIADQLKEYVPLLESNADENLGKQVEMLLQIEEEIETKHHKHKHLKLLPYAVEPLSKICSPDIRSFGKKLSSLCYRGNNFFLTKGLPSNLYFSADLMDTAYIRTGKDSVNSKRARGDLVLLVQDGKTKEFYFIVLSIEEGEGFLRSLKSFEKQETYDSTALLNSRGDLIFNDPMGSGFSPDQLKIFLSLKSTQEVFSLLNLTNGEILYPELLILKLKTWEDFGTFWERVVKTLLFPDKINHLGIDRIRPAHKPKAAPKTPPPKKKRRFFS